MIKLLAIWYARHNVAGQHRVCEIDNPDKIKNFIGEYIYDMGANNILINYKNELYVIESVDDVKRLYNRRKVNYHPLKHLVGA